MPKKTLDKLNELLGKVDEIKKESLQLKDSRELSMLAGFMSSTSVYMMSGQAVLDGLQIHEDAMHTFPEADQDEEEPGQGH